MVNFSRRTVSIWLAVFHLNCTAVSDSNAQQAASDDCLRFAKNIGAKGFEPGPTITACELAVSKNPNDPGLILQLGRALLPKDPKAASDWIRRSADLGQPEAQYMMARIDGQGLNITQEVNWLTKAANNGHKEASYDLGVMKSEGNWVQRDVKGAFELFERAAEAGHARAQAALARSYRDGLGTESNDAKAILWFEKSIQNGNDEVRPELNDLRRQRAIQATPRPELTPVKTELLKAYTAYLTVKACHDIREGYLIKLVTPRQFDQAKRVMREIEDSTKLVKAEKDTVWDVANNDMSQTMGLFKRAQVMGINSVSDDIRYLCQSSLANLESLSPQDAAPTKRDF